MRDAWTPPINLQTSVVEVGFVGEGGGRGGEGERESEREAAAAQTEVVGEGGGVQSIKAMVTA